MNNTAMYEIQKTLARFEATIFCSVGSDDHRYTTPPELKLIFYTDFVHNLQTNFFRFRYNKFIKTPLNGSIRLILVEKQKQVRQFLIWFSSSEPLPPSDVVAVVQVLQPDRPLR
jgi:hypothetical protein